MRLNNFSGKFCIIKYFWVKALRGCSDLISEGCYFLGSLQLIKFRFTPDFNIQNYWTVTFRKIVKLECLTARLNKVCPKTVKAWTDRATATGNIVLGMLIMWCNVIMVIYGNVNVWQWTSLVSAVMSRCLSWLLCRPYMFVWRVVRQRHHVHFTSQSCCGGRCNTWWKVKALQLWKEVFLLPIFVLTHDKHIF